MTVRTSLADDDIWVVAPVGRVDAHLAPALEQALLDLLDRGAVRLVVDLSEATYISSSGLKALLIGLRRARAASGDLRLAAVGERVGQLLSMTGFDSLLAVHASVAEAARSLRAD